ncbi:MAG: hypothetical protein M0006_15950 [Magnetospirillum sp.]|nr:hypothetical protein [Magnetospirillum sp.]
MASTAALQAIATGLNERQRTYLLAVYVEDQRREAAARGPGALPASEWRWIEQDAAAAHALRAEAQGRAVDAQSQLDATQRAARDAQMDAARASADVTRWRETAGERQNEIEKLRTQVEKARVAAAEEAQCREQQ